MVRTSSLVPLLAVAGAAVGRIAVPHRYVVEFAEGAVCYADGQLYRASLVLEIHHGS